LFEEHAEEHVDETFETNSAVVNNFRLRAPKVLRHFFDENELHAREERSPLHIVRYEDMREQRRYNYPRRARFEDEENRGGGDDGNDDDEFRTSGDKKPSMQVGCVPSRCILFFVNHQLHSRSHSLTHSLTHSFDFYWR
jgi:hypothetical protein